MAPWEVWSLGNYKNRDYLNAIRFQEEGNLDSAADSLSSALNKAKTSEEAETYLLLQSSIDLKSGKPDRALSRISKYASKRGIDASQLDSRFSLLTAYAYIAKDNSDQAYAWMVQSFKSGRGVGKVSDESRRIAREYSKVFSPNELNTLSDKWSNENFVSSILREEKSRRLRGGSLSSKSKIATYFSRSNYELAPSTNYDSQNMEILPEDYSSSSQEDIPVANQVIGALLPLSGQYSTHAKKVEQGIRLALKDNNLEDNLVVYDSNAGVLDAYSKLVNQDKAKIIFGPMLVKDVESLASLQSGLTVPLLTYAKKQGLPALSPQIFRLGATPENQLQSLIAFSQAKLNSRKVALLYPEGEVGAEYQDAFQTIIGRGINLTLQSFQYQNRNLSQLENIKAELNSGLFDTVIIADILPSAEPLLRAIKDNDSMVPLNILGVSLLLDPIKISSYHSIMEGVYLVSLFNSSSSNDSTEKFIENYRRNFGGDPDLLSAQSYDSVNFVLSATNNSPFSISKSLQQSSQVLGVTGMMHVLSDGEIHRDLTIQKVVDGKLFEVDTSKN